MIPRIPKDEVLKFLRKKQESDGGYTGRDITELAELLQVTSRGLRRRLSNWIKNYKEFAHFIYLGKVGSSITLAETLEIKHRISSNSAQVKKRIQVDLQNKRPDKKPIPDSTFYRKVNQILLSQFPLGTKHSWFENRQVTIPSDYSIKTNHDLLTTVFTFSDLKTYGGINIEAIYKRLVKAKERFLIYKVKAIQFYPDILTRSRFLRRLLNSIPPDQQLEAQMKLIFEMQASFMVECTDFFIDEIIHKQGRIRQSDNASRQKTENQLRKATLEKLRNNLKELAMSNEIDSHKLREYAEVSVDEELLARIKLLRNHSNAYQLILKFLNDFTSNMIDGVRFHREEVKKVYQLAVGEITWDTLSEQDKHSIARCPELIHAVENGHIDIVPILAISRLIEYIRNGKITFEESYYYQDLGERIKKIEMQENEGYLTPEILEQLIAGTFSVDASFLNSFTAVDIETPDDEVPTSWNDLSDILRKVSSFVRASTPDWFTEHQKVFNEQTDGLFWMEYTEEDFAKHLYDSIGFLGRNFRYRDSESFLNLKYFIQRYISSATLRLELRFVHWCMEQITNRKIEGVVIDTMGVEARIKGTLSLYHGRYRIVGFSDLRAVSIDMTPIYSGVCRSTDSEAMNIVEVIDEVREICGDSVHIYTGNGHTTTRISAGMAYLSHGVIASGRLYHKPKKDLGDRRLSRLKKNIVLLNKVGKLLREEPKLGRVMAMRKHVYVDGLNVRKMVEDTGYLISKNVSQKEIPIDDICQAVERSNHLKKKARIVEGSRTRVEPDEAELLLKSAELILCIAGLFHLLKGWKGPDSPINFSDIRLVIPA